ncbi:MAG: thioredoxin family protein [Chitinophagaceae bacterium]|nr:thioredoxin family protein [Chitinophagaceae bacterium]
MKKLLIAVGSFFIAATVCRAQNTHSLPIGSAVPLATVKLKDISGKLVSVNDAMDRNGVLVMFSCNTCPYVMRNQARTRQLAAFAKAKHIGVILLNSNEGGRSDGDSYPEMQSYARQQNYDFYYAVDTDSQLANAYGASRTPEVYLFDAGGRLQYKGAIDDNPADAGNVKREHARQAIEELAAGKPVTVKESRSVGCGIKRS